MDKHYSDDDVRAMIAALNPLSVYSELHHAAPMLESLMAERDAYRNALETIAQSGECERDAEYARAAITLATTQQENGHE